MPHAAAPLTLSALVLAVPLAASGQDAVPVDLATLCQPTEGMVSVECQIKSAEAALKIGRSEAHVEICSSLDGRPIHANNRMTCLLAATRTFTVTASDHNQGSRPIWGIGVPPGTGPNAADGTARILVPLNPDAIAEAYRGNFPDLSGFDAMVDPGLPPPADRF